MQCYNLCYFVPSPSLSVPHPSQLHRLLHSAHAEYDLAFAIQKVFIAICRVLRRMPHVRRKIEKTVMVDGDDGGGGGEK